MTLNVNPEAVGFSSVTEAGIATEVAGVSAGNSALLVNPTPMAQDPDSVMFASALAGAGAVYLGVAMEHVGERLSYSVNQAAASAANVASEGFRALANQLA
jgi:hypothetical protein